MFWVADMDNNEKTEQEIRDEEHIRLAEANRNAEYVDLWLKTRKAKQAEAQRPVIKNKLRGA